MRRASIVTAVILFFGCINVFAQNATPQWKVVKALQVTQGTAQVPITNLFTPTKTGAYRVTAYVACISNTTDTNAYWYLNFYWTR
jgi:hypothetical protein